MPFKPTIEEAPLEPEFRPTIEEKVVPLDQRSIYDKEVTWEDLVDNAKAVALKNTPAITYTAVAATGAVTLGSLLLSKGAAAAETPAIAASTMSTAAFVTSKILPTAMYAFAFGESLFMSDDEFNRKKITMEEAEDSLSDFDKGLVEAVSLAYVTPEGPDNLNRTAGEFFGSVVRDFLAVQGISIPYKDAIRAKYGKYAPKEIMFSAAMSVNSGVESYNRETEKGTDFDTAVRVGMATTAGYGLGSVFGFKLMPYMTTAVAKYMGVANLSGSMWGKSVMSGNLFAGFEGARKLSTKLTLEAMDEGEKAEDFSMTSKEAAQIWFTGLGLGILGGGAAKAIEATVSILAGATEAVVNKIARFNPVKYESKIMGNELRNMFATVKTERGIDAVINEKIMTKRIADEVKKRIQINLEKGMDKKKAFQEAMLDLPGEYMNDSNIESLLEVFANVY